MNQKLKKIGKGLLWGVGSFVTSIVALATGWIVYSKKYINHHQALPPALDAGRHNFLSARAGRLNYYADLKSSGIPLVLLHSINAAPSAFEMQPLFDHYRHLRPVYALDLPGFGFSERSDRHYSPARYQDAISEFLRDEVGEPADLVCLSLSCEFAGLVAVHSPSLVRSLTMISPTGFKPSRLNRTDRAQDSAYTALAVPIWNRPFYDLISSRNSIRFFLNQNFEGIVPTRMVDYAYMTAHQPGAQFAPTWFLSGKLFTPEVRETVYAAVNQPGLVLYDRDPNTNFEMLPAFLTRNANWQAVRISPTKGLPHWEQPEKTFKALDQFWASLPSHDQSVDSQA